MYENLMEEAVREENCQTALAAVKRNHGSAGIDRMRADELEEHLRRHWPKIRAKLLAGTYVPSPVKRVEIPKPNGGKRELGIPTVQDLRNGPAAGGLYSSYCCKS
jgi:RNA-directed DNA polymerase